MNLSSLHTGEKIRTLRGGNGGLVRCLRFEDIGTGSGKGVEKREGEGEGEGGEMRLVVGRGGVVEEWGW